MTEYKIDEEGMSRLIDDASAEVFVNSCELVDAIAIRLLEALRPKTTPSQEMIAQVRNIILSRVNEKITNKVNVIKEKGLM